MTVDAPSRLNVRIHDADPGLDPLSFATTPGPGPSFFWELPDAGISMAGRGVGHEIVVGSGPKRFQEASAALAELRAAVNIEGAEHPGLGPRLFGGFSFFEESGWPGFPAGRLVLPAHSLLRIGDKAVWIVAESGISTVELTAEPTATLAEPVPPSAYVDLVGAAIDAIESGHLEKVVLARSRRLDLAPDPAMMLAELRSRYPGCATFMIQAAGRSFLGASPETLVRLSGRNVSTVAVAGTAARVQNPAEDEALASRLARDPKELVEHQFVVDRIMADLEGAGCAPIATERRVVALENVQHLVTPIAGQVPNGTDVLQLAGLLHPTPAVGGVPAKAAMRFIRQHEHLERGWYSGPVGVVDLSGSGEFRVALRCGLIEPSQATLFAGAGVVEHSEPTQELIETDLKLNALARICC